MDLASQFMLFVRVVDVGSFSATARQMKVTPSAVSKQISRLENGLGVRLLNRSTRRFALTDEGRALYERCSRIAADLSEVEDFVATMADRPRGTLRVTANVGFAKARLLPIFSDFLKRYPELRMQLELTDRTVDFLSEGVDVAIRFSEQVSDDSVVARKLATYKRVVCAAPAYLEAHGMPETPEALAGHNCLRLSTVSRFNAWAFAGGRETRVIHVDGNFEANSADAIYHAALAGLGIARLSTHLVGDDIRAGRLVRLLGGYAHETADILAVYPERRNLSPKVRAFIDYLADRLAALPREVVEAGSC